MDNGVWTIYLKSNKEGAFTLKFSGLNLSSPRNLMKSAGDISGRFG